MADSSMNFGKGIKMAATIAGLLLLVGGVIAGVMDTKVRVNVLEQDVDKVESVLEKHVDKQGAALEKIQEGIHQIDKKQNRLDYQIQDIIERLDENH